MKTCHLLLATLLANLTVTPGWTAPAPAPVFKAGFAYRDITPDLGMEQPGGYGKSFHRSFHDPCKVRAAVFDDGRACVALVGTDTLALPREVVLAARREIQQRCGLPPHAVLVGASHSHSSGPVGMVQPGEYDHASELVKDLAYNKSSLADPVFLERLRAQIVGAVCDAHARRVPARCAFGVGHEDKVAFNRRLRMRNGRSFSHPGKLNPEVVDYAGPIDPQVAVIGAWDLGGELLGVMVNYACHATTSPGGISANWIYYLERTIQGALHTRAPVVFLQGACGDITQVNNLSPYENPDRVRWAEQVGGRVGAEAVKALLLAEPGTGFTVDARQKTWRIPRRKPAAATLKSAHETIAQDVRKVGATAWTFAKEILMLDALLAKEPAPEVEVQAVQVGPAVFVSNPAEFFVNLGLDIKKGSPFPITCPVELANGCTGYVPTEEAFGPNGGGYETRLTSYSNLEITAGTEMVNAGLELVRQMKPDALPEPPKARQGVPWTYGNLGPQRE